MFKIGDEFLYYGYHKKLHGNLGVILSIGKHSGKEYECRIEGCIGLLYIDSSRMEKINKIPDWEV